MAKIQKNRSDDEMFVGWKEPPPQGESLWVQDEPKQPVKQPGAKPKNELNQSFVTPELAEKIGKALLELKVQLFKDGIVDYDIKVIREDRRVVLTPVSRKAGGKTQEGIK